MWGVGIDCHGAENLQPNESFNLCIEPPNQVLLNFSGEI